VLSAATAFGILVYICVSLCSKCMKKNKDRQQIKSMNSFNTIEVSANPSMHSQQNMYGNSEQHGLVGKNGGDNFFDDDKANSRFQKPNIAEAIAKVDTGMKKPASKKKKKKKAKDGDINMLSVQ